MHNIQSVDLSGFISFKASGNNKTDLKELRLLN